MSVVKAVKHWWSGDPDVVTCPTCGCPIQATTSGTLLDGMERHLEVVHGKSRSAS